ncbi:MAG: hypothetical protein FJY85_02830 [Deltaproteobacteria bacterium]|nr:hypothetical protein [Deltaproteobacteria bacterium]
MVKFAMNQPPSLDLVLWGQHCCSTKSMRQVKHEAYIVHPDLANEESERRSIPIWRSGVVMSQRHPEQMSFTVIWVETRQALPKISCPDAYIGISQFP